MVGRDEQTRPVDWQPPQNEANFAEVNGRVNDHVIVLWPDSWRVVAVLGRGS